MSGEESSAPPLGLAMSNDPRLPGRHACRKCGATWRCYSRGCSEPEPVNRTLLCLTCDSARAEERLERAEADLAKAKRSGVGIEDATERRTAAVLSVERLRESMRVVYGGASAPRSAAYPIVFLSDEQYEESVRVGTERAHNAVRRGYKHAVALDGVEASANLEENIQGAGGEVASSVYTGLAWLARDNDRFSKGSDLEDDVEVKTCNPNGAWTCWIKDKDRDEWNIVLAVGAFKTWRMVGWINAGEARQKYSLDKQGGIRVPAADLNPIDTLPQIRLFKA